MTLSPDPHLRAMELVKRRLIEPLSEKENSCLQAHLVECSACAQEAAGLGREIRALRMLRPQAPAALVRATQLRCRQRAQELENRNRKLRGVQIACVLSSAWMLLSLPFVWDQFSSIGSIADIFMHFSFVLMWFMPAMIAGAIALWLRPQLSAEDSFPRTAFSGTFRAVRAGRR